jgi:hypothetical protein
MPGWIRILKIQIDSVSRLCTARGQRCNELNSDSREMKTRCGRNSGLCTSGKNRLVSNFI